MPVPAGFPAGTGVLSLEILCMNVERIEAVLKLLQHQSHVGEISVEAADWKLRARRIRGLIPSPPMQLVATDDDATPERQVIRAGMVGIYRAPSKPLRAGDFVTEDTLVGNIDSMRILNPISAQQSGYLVSALVEDGDAVEYGQELFVLDASSSLDTEART
jgi:biotin carboxyl carrier protein